MKEFAMQKVKIIIYNAPFIYFNLTCFLYIKTSGVHRISTPFTLSDYAFVLHFTEGAYYLDGIGIV